MSNMWEGILDKRPHLIPCIVASVLLLGALGDWPYGYYQLLRFVVCGVSMYVAFMAYKRQRVWATWLFGIMAILFNPLAPIHLSRELWQPIDFACAVLFVVMAFLLKQPAHDKQPNGPTSPS